jgi:hypothetical protein
MLVIPTTIKPFGVRTTLPKSNDDNCAQSLRPTFDGWGPRL